MHADEFSVAIDEWIICIAGRVLISPQDRDNDCGNPWLLRVPEVFAGMEAELMHALGAQVLKNPGRDYILVRIGQPSRIRASEAAKFVRWNLPMHHMWPCYPRETAGFIEKAAQAMLRKFGPAMPHAILTGPLDPDASNRYYKTLASNLRGRLLQLFPPDAAAIREADAQDSRMPALYGLVGQEGLFCGIQSPLESNGFYPGGTKFIRQSSPGMISRAGAKIAEALHYLTLHRSPPPAGSHWLELGASPGGMTAELLDRGYRVTAVDRAPMDDRLSGASALQTVRMDAAAFIPRAGTVYDAILSDMNGDALESIERVSRFTSHLRPGGLVVFTLKMPGISGFSEITELETAVAASATAAGLHPFATTHLTYNRHEFTMFLERSEKPAPRISST